MANSSLPIVIGYDRISVGYGGYSVVVNTSGCGPEDRGFKSHYSPKLVFAPAFSFQIDSKRP